MLIDFHAHVLPGADHGSSGLPASDAQLSAAQLAGVEMIVATPHFYPNRHKLDSFLERRDEAARASGELFRKYAIGRKLGAEVLLCEGLENLENIQKLCIEGTSCILLELPFYQINERLLNTICEMEAQHHLTPIIAHIDRYPLKDMEQVMALDTLGQINAEAFSKPIVKKQYAAWMNEGKIQALGSDSHEGRNAYTQFRRATKRLGDKLEPLMQHTAELLNIQYDSILNV